MNSAAVEAIAVTKTFEGGMIPALNGATMHVDAGEFSAIVGPSGCGKSTLLHLIAALDRPDGGTIRVNGNDLSTCRDLSDYRARQVGIIFQLHNLIPTLNASENVQVPMFEIRIDARERRRRAEELLGLVGMQGKERMLPTRLSGGERQRVAIARALANQPPILLADEPTGNLDSAAGELVLALLEQLRTERGLTVLMVTHDMQVAARADRIIRMIDGRVIEQRPDAAVNAVPPPAVHTADTDSHHAPGAAAMQLKESA
jgi:putative ABC transport system ATP-binding protein